VSFQPAFASIRVSDTKYANSDAFDNNGKNYDPSGNLTDVPWWTNKTLQAFETRAECFVDEYSNFTAS
jgi:endothelin-converting enzyme